MFKIIQMILILFFSKNYIIFLKKLYYFSQKILLFFSKNYIIFLKFFFVFSRVLVGQEGRDSEVEKKEVGDYWVVKIRHLGAYPAYRVDFARND